MNSSVGIQIDGKSKNVLNKSMREIIEQCKYRYFEEAKKVYSMWKYIIMPQWLFTPALIPPITIDSFAPNKTKHLINIIAL